LNTEKSGGSKIKDAYIEHGVNMLSKSARYPKAKGEDKEKGGGQDQWPIIDAIRERMMTGKFKVFSNLSQWFEEKRSYHVKANPNGTGIKIVDRRDDILKATFYAVMMLRYAVSQNEIVPRSNTISAPIATSRL
jgi:hypothetical protein